MCFMYSSAGRIKYIVQSLDDFVHEGPNGCHLCLIFEFLGPIVDMMVNDTYHF